MHNKYLSDDNEPNIAGYNPEHGLTAEQVEESRRLYGDNTFTPPAKQSVWSQYMGKYNDPLIKILVMALLLSVGISCYEVFAGARGLDSFLEPLGIGIAIILATTVGFMLELSANKKFEMLNRLSDGAPVKVRRGGNITTVAKKDLVVGDIVILDTGEKVPADGKLLHCVNLIVNESSLTGEPQVSKSHLAEQADSNATYPTWKLLRSSNVLEGTAVMMVTAVGDCTEYGKVFEAVHINTEVETPLTRQLTRLGTLISYVSYSVGAIIVIARTLIYDEPYLTLDFLQYSLTSVMLAVTLIVVSVPEGLPMSVTLSLALSMRRMLATNNLVRKMHACETMGATTVICTDKTGTLTQNRMTVYDAKFENSDKTVSKLVAQSIAANTSAFIDRSKAEHEPVGNPTEGALLMWLEANGYDYEQLRIGQRTIGQIPFTTELKYMATEAEDSDTGKHYLYVKGAPEILLDNAETDNAEAIKELLSKYQSQAMRTLGFAYAEVPEGEKAIVGGKIAEGIPLKFMGVVAISDPLRDDVPQAVAECTRAGIKVVIVTGDTPGTAKEIGREAGVLNEGETSEDKYCISGPEFAALDEATAQRRANEIRVMSRARPSDKSRLVKHLQNSNEVVAVTGDGTNDAPALNAAHVGLAMGSGTAVAKEAGDIVILDNSFASITRAVMWGRSLYRNIQRFILFQLTVNIVACMIVSIGAFTSFQSPLTVTQMLWVNLIMDTFAAMALASLPPSKSVLYEKPRGQKDFIITRNMSVFIIGIGLLFTAMLFGLLQYLHHFSLETLTDFSVIDYFRVFFDFEYDRHDMINGYELTIFFTVFIAMQFWNLFNAKSYLTANPALNLFHNFKNCLSFYGTAGVILIGQGLIVAFGGEMFSVVPLSVKDFVLSFVFTAPVLLLSLPFTKSRSSKI